MNTFAVKNIAFLLLISIVSAFGQQHVYPGKGYNIKHKKNYDPNIAIAAANDSLKSIYRDAKCGLNYTSSSLVLGKKMFVYGMPYQGIDQPAPMIISNISTGAKIEKAYVWWDLTGPDTVGNVIIKNPNLTTDTFPGVLIGKGIKCWGPSSAFRADVTNIITGNGTYTISGLPTDTTFTQNDVNGATLFVIYSDSLANYAGHLEIHDGYVRAFSDTIYESIDNMSVNNNYNGKAFMLVADFENQPGNALKMNNGPFLGVTQDYWDFEEKNTVYTNGQTSSVFGVSSPNDCSNLICIGSYYQEPYSLTTPTISIHNDTLTSSLAASYQWVYNGAAISGASLQKHIANQSGNYSVIVSYTNSACYISSTTYSVTTCQDKIKPNIQVQNDSMWTDSIAYQLQWYYNGSIISGATSASYTATLVGNYWLQVTDTVGGCVAISDTIYNSFAGINSHPNNPIEVNIIPNPNNGNFSLYINSQKNLSATIELTNINGQVIFNKTMELSSQVRQQIQVNDIASGIYILKIITDDIIHTNKIAVN